MTTPNPADRHRKSHESAEGHVTGKAIYTDEQRPPADLLSLYPVLSAHAHAHRRETPEPVLQNRQTRHR